MAHQQPLPHQPDIQHSSHASSSIGGQVPAPSTSRDRLVNSCITKVVPLHLSQKWKVDNFASIVKLSKPGSCLRSHVFKDAAFSDACWQLCLYPGGKREENANHVSLFLKMSATTPSKEVLLKAEYRFYFMDESNNARFSNVNIGDFHAKPPKGGHSWGLRNIPRQKVLNSLRDDGSLMVLCEIELIPDISKIRCQLEKPIALSAAEMISVPRSFVDSQRQLLTHGDMSDYEIEVRDNKSAVRCFSAHRCILGAHSDVFRAMFSHEDIRETVERRIVIEEFSSTAVYAMLEYMYTGAIVLTSTEHIEELIGLSEKYGLSQLKCLCQDALISRIDRTNICSLLAMADLYSADPLMQACIAYFSSYKKEVMSSNEWIDLKHVNPRLVNQLLESLVRGADTTTTSSPPPNKRLRAAI